MASRRPELAAKEMEFLMPSGCGLFWWPSCLAHVLVCMAVNNWTCTCSKPLVRRSARRMGCSEWPRRVGDRGRGAKIPNQSPMMGTISFPHPLCTFYAVGGQRCAAIPHEVVVAHCCPHTASGKWSARRLTKVYRRNRQRNSA